MDDKSTPLIPKPFLYAGGAIIAFIFLLVLNGVSGGFGYFNHPVRSDEVGLRFVQNKPIDILGPGVYTDWSPTNMFQFKGITTINISSLPFTVEDDEVLTADRQRIGVLVQGAVLRPGLGAAKQLLQDWATYRQFYTNNASLVGDQHKDDKGATVGTAGLIQNLGKQAVKVCVGDKKFDEVVVGSARDALKDCIDTELTKLASGYGLTVQNIVVPNFVLSPDVQKQLDAITTSRLATNVAQQQASQNQAQADADVVKQAGAIRVEQSKAQETAKQQAILAGLAADAANAKNKQIEAEKANDLLSAQKDKDIQVAAALAAAEKAKADLASKQAEAAIYQANPNYTQLLEIQAEAAAYKNTDKTVIVPQGTNPTLLIGDPSKAVVPVATK